MPMDQRPVFSGSQHPVFRNWGRNVSTCPENFLGISPFGLMNMTYELAKNRPQSQLQCCETVSMLRVWLSHCHNPGSGKSSSQDRAVKNIQESQKRQKFYPNSLCKGIEMEKKTISRKAIIYDANKELETADSVKIGIAFLAMTQEWSLQGNVTWYVWYWLTMRFMFVFFFVEKRITNISKTPNCWSQMSIGIL